MLQFAKNKSNHSRAKSQITKDDSFIQLSPSRVVSLSSIKHAGGSEEKLGENGIRHGAMDFSEQGVEWMESEPSQTSLATQSLSAVKRKEQHKKSIVDSCGVDEVLEALKDENESLTNLHVNMDTKSQLAGRKVAEMKKPSQTFDDLKKSSIATTELERESKHRVESAAPRIKGSLLPSLPFRPVLVNRYKQTTVTAAKTLARPRDTAATKSTMPLAREEDYTITSTGAPLQHRQPQVSSSTSEDGGGEVARESLTEQTVKIITDKVRQMDAR